MALTINGHKLSSPQAFAKECFNMGLNTKEFLKHLYQHNVHMAWILEAQAEWNSLVKRGRS